MRMLQLRRAAGVLIVAAVLLFSAETNAGQTSDLEVLTELRVHSSDIDVEHKCKIYEQVLRRRYPADQQAALNRDKIFAKVLAESDREQSPSAEAKRVVDDIRWCMGQTPTRARGDTRGVQDGGRQQAQADNSKLDAFTRREMFELSKMRYESGDEPLEERCIMFDKTLRIIFSIKKPALADASPSELLAEAITRLEATDGPILHILKKCSEGPVRYPDIRPRVTVRARPDAQTKSLPENDDDVVTEMLNVKKGLRRTGDNFNAKSVTKPTVSESSSTASRATVSERSNTSTGSRATMSTTDDDGDRDTGSGDDSYSSRPAPESSTSTISNSEVPRSIVKDRLYRFKEGQGAQGAQEQQFGRQPIDSEVPQSIIKDRVHRFREGQERQVEQEPIDNEVPQSIIKDRLYRFKEGQEAQGAQEQQEQQFGRQPIDSEVPQPIIKDKLYRFKEGQEAQGAHGPQEQQEQQFGRQPIDSEVPQSIIKDGLYRFQEGQEQQVEQQPMDNKAPQSIIKDRLYRFKEGQERQVEQEPMDNEVPQSIIKDRLYRFQEAQEQQVGQQPIDSEQLSELEQEPAEEESIATDEDREIEQLEQSLAELNDQIHNIEKRLVAQELELSKKNVKISDLNAELRKAEDALSKVAGQVKGQGPQLTDDVDTRAHNDQLESGDDQEESNENPLVWATRQAFEELKSKWLQHKANMVTNVAEVVGPKTYNHHNLSPEEALEIARLESIAGQMNKFEANLMEQFTKAVDNIVQLDAQHKEARRRRYPS